MKSIVRSFKKIKCILSHLFSLIRLSFLTAPCCILQVLLCYGSYSNLELLEHYGFLLKSNLSDKAFIQLDMGIRSSHSWANDSLYIQQDGKPSFALLSALRLWATAPNLRREVGHLAYSGSQISTENEVSVMKWLSKNCQGLLETLPTSMEEDGLLLDVIDKMQNHWSPAVGVQMLACEGELNDFFQANGLQKGDVAGFQLTTKAMRSMQRWRLAVEWRFRYKKILLDCITFCTKMVSYLSSHHVSGKRTNHVI